MIRALIAFLILSAPGPASALELNLPTGARLTVERNSDPDVFAAPVGIYAEGRVPKVTLEGAVRRGAWQLQAQGITPLQLMRPLRAQLEDAGFDIVLDCAADACGGFDFRFELETFPGPNMYVNLRDYHVVTALRGDVEEPGAVVNVLTSTSARAAYVQIIQVGALGEDTVEVATGGALPLASAPTAPGDLAGALRSMGHVVLSDLEFETGSSALGAGNFASLDKLAAFMADEPGARVALVGHTDSVGGLAGNIALSKRRAQSVRQRMIDAHGIDGARMEAEGMGYLSPVASNLRSEGREANRRVEVILLNIE